MNEEQMTQAEDIRDAMREDGFIPIDAKLKEILNENDWKYTTIPYKLSKLIVDSIAEALIHEYETMLGFPEKYWEVNAYKHFNNRIYRLKEILGYDGRSL